MIENIMAIAKVEGLLGEASKFLHELIPVGLTQETMTEAAIEELQDYLTDTLHDLRLLFEE